ncbi:hypothetical protein NDS46_16085 [Paenibacillus thiaminolyticus]|uniref:hypothetical protein n=1 Tax=Paenibacillus thiaminolyticus TaxID=49283 RepID=UPI00232BF1C0|nr:hypothetical protein [Paenibacillus thiaminolyticus]WCF05902.1 hypothetical protein NDS46_16085 [Paenibacillus thiaminolyticus]
MKKPTMFNKLKHLRSPSALPACLFASPFFDFCSQSLQKQRRHADIDSTGNITVSWKSVHGGIDMTVFIAVLGFLGAIIPPLIDLLKHFIV